MTDTSTIKDTITYSIFGVDISMNRKNPYNIQDINKGSLILITPYNGEEILGVYTSINQDNEVEVTTLSNSEEIAIPIDNINLLYVKI